MSLKCYKCNSEIALIYDIFCMKFQWGCIPCLYSISKNLGKLLMPFTKAELELIQQGKKWTSLRSLEYDKFPFEKCKLLIHDNGIIHSGYNNTTKFLEILYPNEIYFKGIYKSEGYNSWKELITAIKKMRHKLPKEFYLYDLRKPIL